MQAIQVKYLGPTNTKGSRYKAFCDAGSLTVSASYKGTAEYDYHRAAEALANKLGWHGKWFGGVLPNQDMVFVCAGLSGLADKPDFTVSKKPEGGWTPEQIADYDAAMALMSE